MHVANPRSLVLFVAVTLGVIATPAIGQGLWSNGDTNGDRNGSNPSTGWVNVRQITSSQIAPALAASNEVHLVDVGGPFPPLASTSSVERTPRKMQSTKLTWLITAPGK